MKVLGHHVDREGFVHVEMKLEQENAFKRNAILGMLSVHGINDVVEVDHRVEETGFEFWHIKGV